MACRVRYLVSPTKNHARKQKNRQCGFMSLNPAQDLAPSLLWLNQVQEANHGCCHRPREEKHTKRLIDKAFNQLEVRQMCKGGGHATHGAWIATDGQDRTPPKAQLAMRSHAAAVWPNA